MQFLEGITKSPGPFAVFVDETWQGASLLPARDTGHAKLTADRGAAGPNLAHATIRRWTSPIGGKVSVSGTLSHNVGGTGRRFEFSNGVYGRIISSRQGVCQAA